ncbi:MULTISPECIES: hypothetical protein [unclassified Paenibacillus]|uniref:hypothetical protein n=1 Tax=unclassified Paenibacillus TaxID=185978 RepID=UPI000373DD5D|nr:MULTISPECIES: hypothetical protein [unclassified Paenibacillus]MCM3342522.1 hypothetical protein [Paenibacillus sp. MER TA 81-3]
MQIQKDNIKFTFIISVFSFAAALWVSTTSNGFWLNVLIGIFSSGLLTLFLSVVAYRIEKKKTLEAFYSSVIEVINNFSKYEKNDDAINTINAVLSMNEFNYMELDTSYGNISFLVFDKRHREYINQKIYSRINIVRNAVAEKSFHFKEFKKSKNGNLRVMEIFINEIDDLFITKTIKEIADLQGQVIKLNVSFNKITKELSDELKGDYFILMYGKKGN